MTDTESSPESTERTPLLGHNGSDVVKDERCSCSLGRILGFVVALVGVFIAGADQSFLTVTYESIASQFDDVSNSAWVLTGYNLGYCAALPVYGKLSDTYGRKHPLAASCYLFSIGCLLSGSGTRLWHVVAGRIITGLGGAGMVALISVVVTDQLPHNQVALARSYVNIVNVSGRALGGPLGALIADAIGWRWSFIAQAPITLICGFTYMLLMSGSQVLNKKVGNDAQKAKAVKKIDFIGIATFTITITSLLAAIELLNKSDWRFPLALFSAAAAFGLTFILIETYYAEEPLIPMSLLKTAAAFYFVLQALLFFGRQAFVSRLAPYFLWTRDIKMSQAALLLIPSPIGFTLGSVFSGVIIQRTNRFRSLCIASTTISTLIYLLITLRWGANRQLPGEWLYTMPAGFSLGIVMACTFTGLIKSTEDSMQGTAICMYYLSQQVGSIMGTAVSTISMHLTFEKMLLGVLHDTPHRNKVVSGILKHSGLRDIPDALHEIVRSGYKQSFQYISSIPVVSTALAALLTMALPKTS